MNEIDHLLLRMEHIENQIQKQEETLTNLRDELYQVRQVVSNILGEQEVSDFKQNLTPITLEGDNKKVFKDVMLQKGIYILNFTSDGKYPSRITFTGSTHVDSFLMANSDETQLIISKTRTYNISITSRNTRWKLVIHPT